MQLVDRIEKRRFVGRELLLWLWFESEILDATLSTAEHGSFGLWIEKQLVLSAGKEATRIKGALPAGTREAKEAVLGGKLPETAGIHLAIRDQESSFVLKAEQLGISGMKLPAVLGEEEEAAPVAIEPPRPRKRRAGGGREERARAASDEMHEAFYERMHLTRDVEGVLEALYRDFLALRLGPAWEALVVPALRVWAAGGEVDADAYVAARAEALTGRKAKRASAG